VEVFLADTASNPIVKLIPQALIPPYLETIELLPSIQEFVLLALKKRKSLAQAGVNASDQRCRVRHLLS